MGSLKEVKDRIDSVKSTMKITSAMRMIASAKLRKSQLAIASFLPYSSKLNEILLHLLASESNTDLPYTKERQIGKVAIVAFSSNSSLCGAFNANIYKEVTSAVAYFSKMIGTENITIYPIGKKIKDFCNKKGLNTHFDERYINLVDKPAFDAIGFLIDDLVTKFLSGEIDKISLIYTHSNSPASQIVQNVDYLPFNVNYNHGSLGDSALNKSHIDYLLEPSLQSLLLSLIPKVLTSNMYSALLDSNASENAARSMAMQIATDNAKDLVGDLTIEYNKSRQAAITGELLDILGGTSALS